MSICDRVLNNYRDKIQQLIENPAIEYKFDICTDGTTTKLLSGSEHSITSLIIKEKK